MCRLWYLSCSVCSLLKRSWRRSDEFGRAVGAGLGGSGCLSLGEMVLGDSGCGSVVGIAGGSLVGGFVEEGLGFFAVGAVCVTTGVGGVVWVATVHVSCVVVWMATAHVGRGEGSSVWVEISSFFRRMSIRDCAYSSTCSLWPSRW